MAQLPNNLEDAIAQAKEATQSALNDGCCLLQVELVLPEIALQAQSIAWDFIPLFAKYGSGLKVLFPDTGAAALARRDWGEVPFKVTDIGTSRSPIETRIDADDEAFLVVSPSAVEVAQVEELSNLAGSRPCLLLNPQMEDIKIVGIGYAARQVRERFLNKIESCYYLQALEGMAILRTYPGLWQVWLDADDGYKMIAELPEKPVGEALEAIVLKATGGSDKNEIPPTKKPGFLSTLQNFLNALSR